VIIGALKFRAQRNFCTNFHISGLVEFRYRRSTSDTAYHYEFRENRYSESRILLRDVNEDLFVTFYIFVEDVHVMPLSNCGSVKTSKVKDILQLGGVNKIFPVFSYLIKSVQMSTKPLIQL
jgi:hypothetical protein